jgi:hypothetical protein
MLLTALPPAPPTPNTTMRGFNSVVRGAESEIAMGLMFLADRAGLWAETCAGFTS